MSLRLIATCPKNLSSPTRDLCITIRKRMYFSGLPCISNPGSSKEASSFQTGSSVFSATDVEYFSLPNWIIVYVSLVPLLPFGFRSLAWSTVTCTWVGNHFWACSDNIILGFCFVTFFGFVVFVFSSAEFRSAGSAPPAGRARFPDHCILQSTSASLRGMGGLPQGPYRLTSKWPARTAGDAAAAGVPFSRRSTGVHITWPPARPPGPGLRAQPDAASRRHRPRACAPAALRPGLRPVRPGSSSDPADTNRTVGGPRGLAPSARAASPRLLPPSRAAEAWASGAEAAAVSWIGTRGRPRRRHEARPASGTRGS